MSEERKIVIQTEVDENFEPNFEKVKDKAQNINRTIEKGIVNEKTGSSVVIRDNGDISMAASEYANYKINYDGRAVETSIEKTVKTNRQNFVVDDFVINRHKLNPALWELTDFKQIYGDEHSAIGNFTMAGTVLVKAWEPHLQRYVLIRRPVRMPMFSPVLNMPEIVSSLGIADPSAGSAIK